MGGPSDWALLARYLSGECSEEEKAEVEAGIASDPEKQRLMASMRAVWDTPDPQPMTSDVSRLWDEIAEKAGIAAKSEAPRDRSRKGVVVRMAEWFQPKVRRYAAAAALLIVASLAYFWAPWDRPTSEFRTLAVESGGRDELTLRGQETVEIVKGQGSTLPKDGQPSEPQPVDIEKHVGWLHQEAFFDGAPLHEILYQLERWYNVRFALEDAAIAAEQLTVHIQAKSLDDVLELISALTGLDYQRTDDSIRLTPRD